MSYTFCRLYEKDKKSFSELLVKLMKSILYSEVCRFQLIIMIGSFHLFDYFCIYSGFGVKKLENQLTSWAQA